MNALFTGVLFGCAIAAPIGPIGLLCLRRTIAGGFVFGCASGLGAACVDGFYALLTVTSLGLATTMLVHISVALHVVGGVALVALGLRTAAAAIESSNIASTAPTVPSSHRPSVVGAFASAFALTIVNPATIVSFAAVVVASGGALSSRGALFAVGVMAGSAAWWLVLCGVTAALRASITTAAIRAIDLLSGLAFVAWGVWSVVLC